MIVPVAVPSGRPAGFTRTTRFAAVVLLPEVEKPVPVVLAVSHPESEVKLKPCLLPSEEVT